MEPLLFQLLLARYAGDLTVIEYAIYKLYEPEPEYWDGPFKTLARAREVYVEQYNPDPGDASVFAIFKITTTKVPAQCPKRKSKPRRASR
jgi:hypothetical protein